MESTSEAGRIQASAEAAQLLREGGSHVLEFRGMTFAKGKGEVETYWVRGWPGPVATGASQGARAPQFSISLPISLLQL